MQKFHYKMGSKPLEDTVYGKTVHSGEQTYATIASMGFGLIGYCYWETLDIHVCKYY